MISFQTYPGSNLCNCTAGYYSSTGTATASNPCVPCPSGSYCAGLNTITPTLCQAGTYSTSSGATSASVCNGCPTSTYGPTTGLTACLSCSAGRYLLLLKLS